MSRIIALWQNANYRKCLAEVVLWEKERKFCRHGPEHLLAVARIAYIMALEDKPQRSSADPFYPLSMEQIKELIYAAALTHDLGRAVTYRWGGDHALESTIISRPLLEATGYNQEEIGLIFQMIMGHRSSSKKKSTFGEIFYRADKLSRPCQTCPSKSECDKIEEMQQVRQQTFY